MKTPHKHAELIKAWADGAEIEWYDNTYREHRWKTCPELFIWDEQIQFRIKHEPKPDVVETYWVGTESAIWNPDKKPNLKLTFDGETGKLKAAEVIA